MVLIVELWVYFSGLKTTMMHWWCPPKQRQFRWCITVLVVRFRFGCIPAHVCFDLLPVCTCKKENTTGKKFKRTAFVFWMSWCWANSAVLVWPNDNCRFASVNQTCVSSVWVGQQHPCTLLCAIKQASKLNHPYIKGYLWPKPNVSKCVGITEESETCLEIEALAWTPLSNRHANQSRCPC